MTTVPIDLGALKGQLKAMWMAGDFGLLALYTTAGDMQFLERLELRPGEKMLDAGCGTGGLAILAAQAGAAVTGIDIAPNLIAQARAHAKSKGVNVHFDEGDVEELPYEPRSFYVVVSQFGVMFAPRPPLAAAELLRVCRPGGRIVLDNWTAEGFVGRLFSLVMKYAPPRPTASSPFLWGSKDFVRKRFASGASQLRLEQHMYSLQFPFSPAETVELYIENLGPIQRTFASMASTEMQDTLRQELRDLFATANQTKDGTTRIDSEFLEVTAIRA